MITVRLENAEQVIAKFRGIADDQIPFAMARSLTATAQRAQEEIRRELPVHFTLRRRSWIERGVRIEPATKASQQSKVKDIDPFMDLQEEGGAKSAGGKYKLFSYKGMVCIPLTRGVRAPRRKYGALIRKEDYPEAVMASGLGFIRHGVMYRRGAHYKRPKKYMKILGPGAVMSGIARDKVTAMYALVPAWQVKKSWNFYKTAAEVTQRVWPEEFEKAFKQAVETRR